MSTAAERPRKWAPSLTARLNLVLLLIVLIATINAALALNAASERTTARDASTKLRSMAASAVVVSQSAIDQETDQRGFLVTGDPTYLEQYAGAGTRFDKAIARLEASSGSNPAVAKAVDTSASAAADWRDHAEDVEVRIRLEQGISAAGDAVSTGEGKQLFDDLRTSNTRLQTLIEAQLETARSRSAKAYDRFVQIVTITLGAVILVAIALAILLSRWITRPVQRLAASVGEVQSGNLDRHVDISGPSELVQIGEAVENMRRRLVDELSRSRAAADELAQANAELEAFSYSVSHDLRAPLRSIDGFSQALIEDAGDQLDEVALGHFRRIRAATQRMGDLIDDLLKLSKVSRVTPMLATVDVSAVAQNVVADLRAADPDRHVEIEIQPGLTARADPSLVQVVFENLLGNAWKFTSNVPAAHITVSGTGAVPHTVYSVTDDGAGFDQAYAGKLFSPFQRLHTDREFPGTGIGLATVARIVHRHGGRISATGAIDEGARMEFTLARDLPTEKEPS